MIQGERTEGSRRRDAARRGVEFCQIFFSSWRVVRYAAQAAGATAPAAQRRQV